MQRGGLSYPELSAIPGNLHSCYGGCFLHCTELPCWAKPYPPSSCWVCFVKMFGLNNLLKLERFQTWYCTIIFTKGYFNYRYTHIEGECPFITFDQLLDRLEDLVCDVVQRVLDSPFGYMVKELNPDFKPPKKPFRRMNYSEAIEYLKANNITKDDGSFYEFGEDIPEMPERKMTDKINEPIMLCRFPAEIKSFYMAKCPEDKRLTESVRLFPLNLAIYNSVNLSRLTFFSLALEKLLEAPCVHGTCRSSSTAISVKASTLRPIIGTLIRYEGVFRWLSTILMISLIKQRKFGTCPHGGYGLGLERFLCWLLNRYHIREVCLYPRFLERCKP